MNFIAIAIATMIMIVFAVAGVGRDAPVDGVTTGQVFHTHTTTSNAPPSWWQSVKFVKVGMRRSETEAVLPTNVVTGVTSCGMAAGGTDHRSYYFADGWTVTIAFEAPMVTKNGTRTWDYGSPEERVIEMPKITHGAPFFEDGATTRLPNYKR